jgi:predicted O-linked N-acetylglucosamine transferase (SPINDLY family)
VTKTKIGRNDPCPCGSGRKYKVCCGSASAAKPRTSSVHNQSLIQAAQQEMNNGQLQRAQQLARQAIEANPGSHAAWRTAGEIAHAGNQFKSSERFCRKALSIAADDRESLYLLGTSLARQRHYDEALQHLEKVVNLYPSHWRAYNNLGNVYRETGRHDKALACYDQVFAHQESSAATLSNILLGLHFHIDGDHQRQFEMHRQVGKRIEAEAGPMMPARDISAEDARIRIGYFSPRFKPGVIGDFFVPLFDAHDRSRFELHLYSDLEATNTCSEYLAQEADGWTDTCSLTDKQFAEAVRSDKIDIFIDLAGHAPGNRLGVFARKPAPVQVCLLDYFDTTGMKAFDYYVSDHCSTPDHSKQQFTENLIRLSQPRLVYKASENYPAVAPLPSLQNGYITFGSFNRCEKITTPVVDLWARILKRIPTSRLILKDRGFGVKEVVNRYREMFSHHGVNHARLEFRGWSDHQGLLEEYGDVDIALDPFPYNGGLTTCEALWMGVPVISLLGSRIINRQSACMMLSVGLDQFVGENDLECMDAAIYWASHLDQLSWLRGELRERVANSPLCDSTGFTRELESFFSKVVQQAGNSG